MILYGSDFKEVKTDDPVGFVADRATEMGETLSQAFNKNQVFLGEINVSGPPGSSPTDLVKKPSMTTSYFTIQQDGETQHYRVTVEISSGKGKNSTGNGPSRIYTLDRYENTGNQGKVIESMTVFEKLLSDGGRGEAYMVIYKGPEGTIIHNLNSSATDTGEASQALPGKVFDLIFSQLTGLK